MKEQNVLYGSVVKCLKVQSSNLFTYARRLGAPKTARQASDGSAGDSSRHHVASVARVSDA